MLIVLPVRLQGGDSANLAKSWHGCSATCQVFAKYFAEWPFCQLGRMVILPRWSFCQELCRMKTLKTNLPGSKCNLLRCFVRYMTANPVVISRRLAALPK
eukprot:3196223-Pleurochrysis_carterae.AAC.1